MGSEFADLLEQFIEGRDLAHSQRTDPDRDAMMLRVMESTLQAMLEKLRDIHDKR